MNTGIGNCMLSSRGQGFRTACVAPGEKCRSGKRSRDIGPFSLPDLKLLCQQGWRPLKNKYWVRESELKAVAIVPRYYSRQDQCCCQILVIPGPPALPSPARRSGRLMARHRTLEAGRSRGAQARVSEGRLGPKGRTMQQVCISVGFY